MLTKRSNNIKTTEQIFKSDTHNVYTEYVHKIVVSSKDDRLNSFDKVKSYIYGARAGIVCKEKLLKYKRRLILMVLQMQ